MTVVTVSTVPSRRVVPPRSSQIEDEIWFPALRIAHLRGEVLGKIMRMAVVRYVARNRHLVDDDPDWPTRLERYKSTKRWD